MGLEGLIPLVEPKIYAESSKQRLPEFNELVCHCHKCTGVFRRARDVSPPVATRATEGSD